ncbi:MAG: hypothetical protein KKA54_07730 [Proteobacteria bacterium]|nr:hypothetical protein [Pseudomonadota bacterium]MBU0966255.1 hypothetical protein [Pseudomonadota bacterium]
MGAIEIINIVIGAIGGSSIALTGAYFLSKKLIEHQFNKELLIKKAELEENAISLKNKFSIFAHEQMSIFTRLEEERADAIKNIHTLFYGIEWDLSQMSLIPLERLHQGLKWKDPELITEDFLNILDKIKSTRHEIEKSSIYFQSKTLNQLKLTLNSVANSSANCIKSHKSYMAKHNISVRDHLDKMSEGGDDINGYELREKIGEAYEKFDKEVNEIIKTQICPIRELLAYEFREILSPS